MKRYFLIYLILMSGLGIVVSNSYLKSNKITSYGDTYLKSYDSDTEYIVLEEYINTATLELVYSDYEAEIVIEDNQLHYDINNIIMGKYNLEFFDYVYISMYAPFVTLAYEGEENTFINKLLMFDRDERISEISVYREHEVISYVNGGDLGGPNDCTYPDPITGCGGGAGRPPATTDPKYPNLGSVPETGGDTYYSTKIGIIDGKVPNFNDPALSNTNWKVKKYDTGYSDLHATLVAKEIKNRYEDLSPYNSNHYVFLAASSSGLYSIFEEIEWMISEDVSVINISMGSGTPYDSRAKQLDYIIYTNNLPIVAALPNIAQAEAVTFPGLCHNTIAVGRLGNNNIAMTNEYVYNETFDVSKPNLVDNGDSTSDKVGTSFATPKVTAKIAKLLWFAPYLRYNLPLLISIVHSGSDLEGVSFDNPSYDPSGLEDKVGSGIVEYARMKDIAYFDQYRTVSKVVDKNEVVLEYNIPIVQKNQRIYISAVSLGYGSSQTNIVIPKMSMVVEKNMVAVRSISANNLLYVYTDIRVGNNIRIKVTYKGNNMEEAHRFALSWRYKDL
ncbi:S8 family serine peptidase [Acholeplasma sp. OttesenSCG-928-E16]|nr:S8 family serine peptidase [Acholeplasma sp. OttesenSCG-928-E16]